MIVNCKKGLLWLIVIAGLHASGGYAESVAFEQTVRVGGEDVSVVIKKGKFKKEGHQLEVNPDGVTLKDGYPLIDGKRPIGIDPFVVPAEEIVEFSVKWNGRELEIPSVLYSDIYAPDISPALTDVYTPRKVTGVVLVGGRDAVLVEMRSTLCAVRPYTVSWIIRRNGKSERYVLNEPG